MNPILPVCLSVACVALVLAEEKKHNDSFVHRAFDLHRTERTSLEGLERWDATNGSRRTQNVRNRILS